MFRKYKTSDGLNIEMPEKIFLKIQATIMKYYPNECGGIFIGKIIMDENNAVIEKMILPRKFQSSPVYFLRFSSFINKWLFKAFNQSNGETFYLGEWHSHPDGPPYPSQKDYDTMKKIALNNNVRIKTPLLLIVGYNQKSFEESFFIFLNNKLHKYEPIH